ncbi:MAG TPA: hypothetical protein PLH29_02140 [bacterium]|nr:hypothetical protein [bacterium]
MTYSLVQKIVEIMHDFLMNKPDHFLARNRHVIVNPLACRMTSGIVLKVAKCTWAPVGVCTILGGSELWSGSQGNFRKILPDILVMFGADINAPMYRDEHYAYYAVKKIGSRQFDSPILDKTAFCHESDLKLCQEKWKKMSTTWRRANNRRGKKEK